MRRFWPGRPALCLALTLVLAAPAPAAPAGAELATLLARLKGVGREGAGNVEAARAWKALVARGPGALTAILAAMDDDDLTSANWLRPAVNAVAEQALRAGKPLPRAELEKFVGDTKHAGSARRLAYELLVQLDPTTPDRLLPKMLHDNSPELRRDAVARALDGAKKLLDKEDRKGATEAYRKALAAACDKDQVDDAAKQLDKLGVKVDLAKHFGVVSRWHLVAPFDHSGGVGFARAYAPEQGVDLAAAYKGKGGAGARWSEHATTDPYGVVDLNKALGKHKGAVAYAFAVVDSPKAREVQVRAGSPNGIKLFLNGKEVFAREEYHHGMSLDQYTARGTLKAGRNELLVKVCQNEQSEDWAQTWAFQVRLCDRVGAAVPFTPLAAKAPAKRDKEAQP
jgi:hypothetical protein